MKKETAIMNLNLFKDERFLMIGNKENNRRMQLALVKLLFVYERYNRNMEKFGRVALNGEILACLLGETEFFLNECLKEFKKFEIIDFTYFKNEVVISFVDTESFGIYQDPESLEG